MDVYILEVFRYSMSTKKVSDKEKILYEVDDGIYNLIQGIRAKYGLSWEQAKVFTNDSLRIILAHVP
jgi:hypothetical protein